MASHSFIMELEERLIAHKNMLVIALKDLEQAQRALVVETEQNDGPVHQDNGDVWGSFSTNSEVLGRVAQRVAVAAEGLGLRIKAARVKR